MTLRTANRDDAPALGAILSDWIDATPWMPRLHSRADDLGFVAGLIARCRVTVSCAHAANDRVAGFLALDGDTIPALYIDAAQRGRGHGTALMRAAQAETGALSLWVFQANTMALRFYAGLGFAINRSTRGDNEEGLPDHLMTWSAAPATERPDR